MANASFRLIPSHALVTATLFLLCITSLGAETRYWTEVFNKMPYAVGTSDGVTIAVAVSASTVMDVDVIAFNDTSKDLKIMSRKIRPLAVWSEGTKSRREVLRRWEYRGPGYTISTGSRSSAGSAVSGSQSHKLWLPPALSRLAESWDYVNRHPTSESEPTKEHVQGSSPASDFAYRESLSRTMHAPDYVKPGGVGRRTIAFNRRIADWYEVEVTVAGREFRFKFAQPPPNPLPLQGDNE